jgi:type I restriction enzyme R subunit
VAKVFNEHEYEKRVIEIFEEMNYKYVSSKDMITLRKDLNTTILFDEFETAIKRINDGISQIDINSIVDQIKRMDNANLLLGNKKSIKALTEGVKVYDSKNEITHTYNLIDYNKMDNNTFIVTDQFKMISSHINYDNQIPDLVIYINGLPVSVIELKSPIINEIKSIEYAYDQIKNYQHNMPTLFTWNIINTISNLHINRYGSLTASYTRFSNWRNLEGNKTEPYKYFFNNLYLKENIISIMKDFSFYTSGDDPAKIVAGYHQFLGVKEAKDKVLGAMDNGTGKAGIFWHTQGSGKSLSMVFLTRQVNNIKRNMTTLVITDRKDLDNQLSGTFLNATSYLGQSVRQIESISDLKDTLDNKVQNGIYLCTVQKFDESIGNLSNRDDILIISDEAHRSHKNIHGKLSVIEDEFTVEEKFGYAYFLRKAFPNATFIGFTGTPIESEDHQTRNIFGEYASKYLMTDATEDGFVVPISYESRHAQLKIASEKKEELDKLYSEIRKEIIEKVDLKAEVQKHLNKKIQNMDSIIGDPNRIKEIAEDFVKHYKTRSNLLKGKAMFVAHNRKIAYNYYKEIIKLAPELKNNIRLILTANNQKDSQDMLGLIGNDKYRKDSADVFKDPNSDFKIAIVVDMWLTGFDAPSLDTIYIDKPIKMHNLMQTIARVNRTYTDKNNKNLVKQNRLVVDYIGLWKKLQDALGFYATGGDSIKENAPEDVKIIKSRLMNYVNKIYKDDLNDKVNIDFKMTNDKLYLFKVVEDIQRVVTGSRLKQIFINRTKKLTKEFTSVITSCSYEEKIMIQLLITSRSMIIKRELGQIDIDLKVDQIRKLIADSIIYNKTVISDNIEGERISLTNIINYITKVTPDIVDDALEVEKVSKATGAALKHLKQINIVKAEKLTNKLQILLDKYDANHISIEEFLEGLIGLGDEIKQAKEDIESSDKDTVELAFFEIMNDDEYSKSVYDKKMIEEITHELYKKVKPMLNKRWLYNETIKQNVRAEMKKILILKEYPPKATAILQKKLIKQLQAQIYGGIVKLEEE